MLPKNKTRNNVTYDFYAKKKEKNLIIMNTGKVYSTAFKSIYHKRGYNYYNNSKVLNIFGSREEQFNSVTPHMHCECILMVGSNCGHTTMTNFSERSHSIIIINTTSEWGGLSGITKSIARIPETEWVKSWLQHHYLCNFRHIMSITYFLLVSWLTRPFSLPWELYFW